MKKKYAEQNNADAMKPRTLYYNSPNNPGQEMHFTKYLYKSIFAESSGRGSFSAPKRVKTKTKMTNCFGVIRKRQEIID